MGIQKATSLPFQIKMWPIDFYKGLYFFLPRWLMAHTLRRPPWPRSMQDQGRGRAWRCRGCGLLSAARTDARRCQGTVRSPSATSV